MAKFEVTDPTTGQTVVLEGDSPPTEAELEEIFSQLGSPQSAVTPAQNPQPQQQRGFFPSSFEELGQDVKGGVAGFLNLASGMIAEPVSGIVGLAAAADPFAEEGDSAKLVQEVKDFITLNLEAGRPAVEGIAEPLKPVAESLETIRKTVGDDAFALTGSPAFAAVMTAGPDALLELIGAGLSARAAKGAAKSDFTEDAANTAVQSLDEFEQSTGISQLTTDLIPPETRTAKFFQQMGDLVNPGLRETQQGQRVRAMENLLDRFDISDAGRFEAQIVESVKNSIDEQKARNMLLFDESSGMLDKLGEVPLNDTKNFAREILSKETLKGTRANSALVDEMISWIDAPDNLTFETVKSMRSAVGKDIAKLKRGAEVQGNSDLGLLQKTYERLTSDMKKFARKADPKLATKWERANEEFSNFALGNDRTGAKNLIRQGQSAPEVVDQLLFSKKQSDLDFLANNLDPAGINAARQRILQNVFQKSNVDGTTINPNRFQTNLDKSRRQIRTFFSGPERQAVDEINRALKQTRTAQDIATTTPTGQQTVGLIGLSNPKILLPGVAQAMIERPTIRNLIIRHRAAKTAAERFRINEFIEAEMNRAGLFGAATAAAAETGIRTATEEED